MIHGKIRWLVFVGLFCLLLFNMQLPGQERVAKKIVEYGWDVPYPAFVRDNIKEMEQRPFEGIIFRTKGFNHVFDVRPWEKKELQGQLDTLGQIQWGKFTDNFLTLYSASKWGMDWYNDEHWETIEENLKLFSLAVKTGKCVGVCFDPEPYGTDPWVYPGNTKDKSFDEVCVQVRKRGKQFITALQEHRPELRLLSFFQFGLYESILDEPDAKIRQEKLSKKWMVLLPAFFLGILEGAGPKTIIIDGNETAYYYEDSERYFRAYHAIRQRVLSMVPENLRVKYRNQVQVGMALYIDQVMGTRQGDVLSHYMPHEDQLKFFEHNGYYALTTTDEYVWCYSERMNWWLPPAKAGKDRKLPEGVEAALISARKKYFEGKSLGFDIKDIIAKAREKKKQKQK
jgi:hypothetical protein